MAYGMGILYHSADRGLNFIPYNSPAGLNSSLIFDGARFICRGDNPTIYASQNGLDWEEISLQSDIGNMRATNGIYVAQASGQEYYMYSTDLLTWQQSNMTVKGRLQEANGLIFAFSNDGTLNYTADGATWQTVLVATDTTLNKIVYAGGYYYVCAGSSAAKKNVLFKSADLNAWATITLPSSEAWISFGVSAANIVIGYVTTTGTAIVHYSTNGGETWNYVPEGATRYTDSVVSVPALDVIK